MATRTLRKKTTSAERVLVLKSFLERAISAQGMDEEQLIQNLINRGHIRSEIVQAINALEQEGKIEEVPK